MSAEEIEDKIIVGICGWGTNLTKPACIIMSEENYEVLKAEFFSLTTVENQEIKPGTIKFRGITIFRSPDAGNNIIVR